jgi:signal transduction histidine kinase
MSALQRAGQTESLGADRLSRALLLSLKEHIVVLDREGTVVAFSEQWRDLVRECALDEDEFGVGANLLTIYQTVCRDGPQTPALVAGLGSVLSGARGELTLEYSCPLLQNRWFLVTAVPLKGPGSGAVLTYVDITERRRADDESRRAREEVAHSVRVSMMGELMASLAHELNQPLAAIRSNAQAALRFLSASAPDLEEVRSALAEIVEDDRWASEVIRRLRMLARRGDGERAPIDVNEMVRETLQMVRTEVIERHVAVDLELGPGLPPVLGDRVQLQQVVLNLVLNAVEAMAGTEHPRMVAARTAVTGGNVTVSVRDSGKGLGDADLERIFDAFYTTKPEGLGMGLSISQSIVDSHGGRLWGERNADRGMTFHFSLPATER